MEVESHMSDVSVRISWIIFYNAYNLNKATSSSTKTTTVTSFSISSLHINAMFVYIYVCMHVCVWWIMYLTKQGGSNQSWTRPWVALSVYSLTWGHEVRTECFWSFSCLQLSYSTYNIVWSEWNMMKFDEDMTRVSN